MSNPAPKIMAAVVLAGALAVATTTPSQAQWYGWGWGAPVVAVVPVYGAYPAYAYPYGGPTYAVYGAGIVGHRVPPGYAGYGPAPPSYVGHTFGFVVPAYGYYTYTSR